MYITCKYSTGWCTLTYSEVGASVYKCINMSSEKTYTLAWINTLVNGEKLELERAQYRLRERVRKTQREQEKMRIIYISHLKSAVKGLWYPSIKIQWRTPLNSINLLFREGGKGVYRAKGPRGSNVQRHRTRQGERRGVRNSLTWARGNILDLRF